MKINDTKEVSVMQVSTQARPAEEKPRSDKVSVGKSQELEQAIVNARIQAGADRASKVDSIIASVRNGSYQANPEEIAKKILQAVELDTKLRDIIEK